MFQVSSQLYRGPRPKSFADLHKQGFDMCITLQSGVFEEIHDDEFESQLGLDFGIKHVSIPCSDFGAPQPHEVEKFLRALNYGSKIYVHCLHGKDRTGFMCAVYRMRHCRWTYAQAKSEMFARGFHKFWYWYWLKDLKKWA